MSKRDDRSRPKTATPVPPRVPPGAPPWVTAELIEHTIRVWQPFYRDQLIPDDALAIINGVTGIVEVLSSGADHETVRRIGSGEQP